MTARSYTGIGTAPSGASSGFADIGDVSLLWNCDVPPNTTGNGPNIGGKMHLVGNAAIASTNAHTAAGFTNALQLDGTGDYATCTSRLDIPASTAFYAEVFARSTVALGAGRRAVMAFGVSGQYWTLQWYGPSTTFIFDTSGAGTTLLGTTVTFNTNTWYHIAVSKDASGNWNLYFDGTRIDTGFSNATLSAAGDNAFYLGEETSAYSGSSVEWQGQLCGAFICIGNDLGATGASITVPTTPRLTY
jgi:hypothetical protein